MKGIAMLATTFTLGQLVYCVFFVVAAVVFLLATYWRTHPFQPGLITLGLTLLTCGLLAVFWP